METYDMTRTRFLYVLMALFGLSVLTEMTVGRAYLTIFLSFMIVLAIIGVIGLVYFDYRKRRK